MKKILISTLLVLALCIFTNATTAYADYYSDNTLLYRGMQNSEVTNLQKDLYKLGYFSMSSTGYFGTMTQQSVINYQRANNLAADGIVGHSTARQLKVDKVLKTSKMYIGVPYLWGGTSPAGFDCSGFTHYVFLQNGIVIPRTTELQYQKGTQIAKSALKPGDLVFFTTYKPGPSHVGIYIGNNQFIHASSGGDFVKISNLDNIYYTQHYIGAKRIIQ